MYLQAPVVAVNSGGPRETVAHGQTGYLCDQVSGVDFGWIDGRAGAPV
jgi:glycosyltransferase involved in cell wall biosynthesis